MAILKDFVQALKNTKKDFDKAMGEGANSDDLDDQ